MWTCPKCAARVEPTFEVCWRCGTTAEGVEDPDFVTAEEANPIEDPAIDGASVLKDDDLTEDFAGVELPDVVACYQARDPFEARFLANQLMEQGDSRSG